MVGERGAGEPPTAAEEGIAALAFDEALAELQQIVARLEAGGQPLEETIALYERGVALHERCARLLADAELRVKRLVERAGGALEAVEARDESDGPAN
ncbi:MAG: exodeoxyribonuclease VII small subunit [Chloroflexota bacterium]